MGYPRRQKGPSLRLLTAAQIGLKRSETCTAVRPGATGAMKGIVNVSMGDSEVASRTVLACAYGENMQRHIAEVYEVDRDSLMLHITTEDAINTGAFTKDGGAPLISDYWEGGHRAKAEKQPLRPCGMGTFVAYRHKRALRNFWWPARSRPRSNREPRTTARPATGRPW